jgi:hypothetical protein
MFEQPEVNVDEAILELVVEYLRSKKLLRTAETLQAELGLIKKKSGADVPTRLEKILREGMKNLEVNDILISQAKLRNSFDGLDTSATIQHKKLEQNFASTLIAVPENEELNVSPRSTQSESNIFNSRNTKKYLKKLNNHSVPDGMRSVSEFRFRCIFFKHASYLQRSSRTSSLTEETRPLSFINFNSLTFRGDSVVVKKHKNLHSPKGSKSSESSLASSDRPLSNGTAPSNKGSPKLVASEGPISNGAHAADPESDPPKESFIDNASAKMSSVSQNEFLLASKPSPLCGVTNSSPSQLCEASSSSMNVKKSSANIFVRTKSDTLAESTRANGHEHQENETALLANSTPKLNATFPMSDTFLEHHPSTQNIFGNFLQYSVDLNSNSHPVFQTSTLPPVSSVRSATSYPSSSLISTLDPISTSDPIYSYPNNAPLVHNINNSGEFPLDVQTLCHPPNNNNKEENNTDNFIISDSSKFRRVNQFSSGQQLLPLTQGPGPIRTANIIDQNNNLSSSEGNDDECSGGPPESPRAEYDSDEYSNDDDPGYKREPLSPQESIWELTQSFGPHGTEMMSDEDDNYASLRNLNIAEKSDYEMSGEKTTGRGPHGRRGSQLSTASNQEVVAMEADKQPPLSQYRSSDEDLDYSSVNIVDSPQKLEYFNLKVIYVKGRTGFEESRDFPIRLHDIIAGRYEVIEYLGSAAFSRAVQCLDHKNGQMVCMKIIKNNKDFFDQSLDEIKLLKYIKANGDPDEHHVVQMLDYFYYKEHLFIVCELLRDNLYEFYKYNRESGEELYFNMQRLKKVARQCLVALRYIHSLGLIHCDLKPENILIKSYSKCEVKVIDFGSSCYTSDQLSSYVQSRSYRAPEVILGLPYGCKIDIWSLGCILAELWTGRVMFHNESVPTLLAKITGIIGPFDQKLLKKGKFVSKYFTNDGRIYERRPNGSVDIIIPKKTSLKRRLKTNDPLFLDFITQLLKLNAKDRPTAEEALRHPWLRETNEQSQQ